MSRLRALAWRLGHDVRWHNVIEYDEGDGEWGYFCCACGTSCPAVRPPERTWGRTEVQHDAG